MLEIRKVAKTMPNPPKPGDPKFRRRGAQTNKFQRNKVWSTDSRLIEGFGKTKICAQEIQDLTEDASQRGGLK